MEENRNDELEILDVEDLSTESNADDIEESKGKSKGRKEKKKKEKKPRIKWKELPAEVRKKKRKRYIWIGVGGVILFFFIVSKISAANAKMPVTTEYVEIGDVESTISTSGKVESDVIKTFYSQIGGNIGSVLV